MPNEWQWQFRNQQMRNYHIHSPIHLAAIDSKDKKTSWAISKLWVRSLSQKIRILISFIILFKANCFFCVFFLTATRAQSECKFLNATLNPDFNSLVLSWLVIFGWLKRNRLFNELALRAIPYLYRRFYNNGCGGSQLKHVANCEFNTQYTWRFSRLYTIIQWNSLTFNYFSLVKGRENNNILYFTKYNHVWTFLALCPSNIFVAYVISCTFLNIKSYIFNILFYINTLLFILAILNKVLFFKVFHLTRIG